MSLPRGLWRYRDVDVAVLTLAVGYAVHQVFEAYTLFQTFSSSMLVALTFGMLLFGGRRFYRRVPPELQKTKDAGTVFD